MTQYQIASHVTAGALRAANQAEGQPIDSGTMILLSSAVSTAVSVYGCQNQKAIKKAALKVTPDFSLIADSFFKALTETPVIADMARMQNYEEISEFVVEHGDLTPKQRLALYGEEYAPKSVKFWKGFRIVCLSLTIVCVLIQIGMYLFVPKYREQFLTAWENMKKHAQKAVKYTKLFLKGTKFILHYLTK